MSVIENQEFKNAIVLGKFDPANQIYTDDLKTSFSKGIAGRICAFFCGIFCSFDKNKILAGIKNSYESLNSAGKSALGKTFKEAMDKALTVFYKDKASLYLSKFKIELQEETSLPIIATPTAPAAPAGPSEEELRAKEVQDLREYQNYKDEIEGKVLVLQDTSALNPSDFKKQYPDIQKIETHLANSKVLKRTDIKLVKFEIGGVLTKIETDLARRKAEIEALNEKLIVGKNEELLIQVLAGVLDEEYVPEALIKQIKDKKIFPKQGIEQIGLHLKDIEDLTSEIVEKEEAVKAALDCVKEEKFNWKGVLEITKNQEDLLKEITPTSFIIYVLSNQSLGDQLKSIVLGDKKQALCLWNFFKQNLKKEEGADSSLFLGALQELSKENKDLNTSNPEQIKRTFEEIFKKFNTTTWVSFLKLLFTKERSDIALIKI